MRCASRRRCWAATIGAAARPVWFGHYGRNAWHGLVSCKGYNIQDMTKALKPGDPAQEARLWYQYYFHTERGRNGLIEKRSEISRLLWKMWSPNWEFDEATFERTARSFDNEDFVDVVIHSYRHRTGDVAGDPHYAPWKRDWPRSPTSMFRPSICMARQTA